jgi:hypothetical protein
VREISDGDRPTLPGGWADVNRTAAQNAVKKTLEKSLFKERALTGRYFDASVLALGREYGTTNLSVKPGLPVSRAAEAAQRLA